MLRSSIVLYKLVRPLLGISKDDGSKVKIPSAPLVEADPALRNAGMINITLDGQSFAVNQEDVIGACNVADAASFGWYRTGRWVKWTHRVTVED